MPDRDVYPDPPRWYKGLLWAFVAAVCLALILQFKAMGLVIAVVLVAAIAIFSASRRLDTESEVIKSSVRLAADEISAVLDNFDTFLTGNSAEALADRTLHRPELANPDSTNPDIEKFYYLYASNVRYLHRLEARLQQALTVTQADHLLSITDQRALELQEAWLAARRAAYQLGPSRDA